MAAWESRCKLGIKQPSTRGRQKVDPAVLHPERIMQSKNIVVVGGSRGIGRAIVERCSDRGAAVSVFARSEHGVGTLPGVEFIPLDVLEGPPETSLLPETIDGFAFCPGSIHLGPLLSATAEQMRRDFEINTIAAMQCFQAALPGLKRGGGSALFFSTVAAAQGLSMHTSIAAAKGAVEAMVRTWAAELSPSVRVNCIAPALTDTQLAEKLLSSDARRTAMAAMVPLQRIGTAADMASAAVYLLSPESSWVTGQTLRVDGGMSVIRK